PDAPRLPLGHDPAPRHVPFPHRRRPGQRRLEGGGLAVGFTAKSPQTTDCRRVGASIRLTFVTGHRLDIVLAAAALALLTAAPARADEGARTAPPGIASFRLGALEVTALRDGGYVSPNDGGDFGHDVGRESVARLLAAAGAPTDRVALAVDALLIRAPGRVILVDAGMGPDSHGSVVASLKLAGVTPDQVTDVLITHAHFDHVGGLIDTAGRSAFPKATIWISAREWAAMLAAPGAHRITPAIRGGPRLRARPRDRARDHADRPLRPLG